MGCSYGQINTFMQNEGKINVVQSIALVRKMPVVRRSRLNGLQGEKKKREKRRKHRTKEHCDTAGYVRKLRYSIKIPCIPLRRNRTSLFVLKEIE